MATANPSSNFTRPNNAVAYASGQLVANNTTNTLVTPLSWLITSNIYGLVQVRRVRIKKSTTSTTNASFRVHMYAASPTVSNGDGAAWLSTESGYLGSFDVTVDKAFSDGADGAGVPASGLGTEITVVGSTDMTVYGLVEARAAYTPGALEVFTITLETVSQNF